MSITLDGNVYKTYGDVIDPERIAFGSTARAIDGSIVRQELNQFSLVFRNYILICTPTEKAMLLATFAKRTPADNCLNFVDEYGFNWNPGAGTNDATHAYSTGVYFVRMGTPRGVHKRTTGTGNKFIIEIDLVVNAKGLTT